MLRAACAALLLASSPCLGATDQSSQLLTGVPDTWRGVGVVFGRDATVIDLIEEMQTAPRGVHVGDRVLAVGGTPVGSGEEAAASLRATSGPTARVKLRSAAGDTRELDLPLGPLLDVRWSMLEGGVAYLRIRRFDDDSPAHLRAAIEQARASGARAWVLDLTSGAGGTLGAVVATARLFLDRGTIVIVRGRTGVADRIEADGADTLRGMPLAIAIDERTSGAGEILAAALRENGRAKLVGRTTAGDSTLQTLLTLPGKGAVRIVVARAYTPGDGSFQGVGVVPDLKLADQAPPTEIAKIAANLIRPKDVR